jgi:catechol 2,3-dioxygenase-like lactoylglutathione lyase family enzyme
MGVLDSAVPMLLVASTDLDRSIGFYRDTLGLTLHAQDAYAAIFQLGAATLLRVVPGAGDRPLQRRPEVRLADGAG